MSIEGNIKYGMGQWRYRNDQKYYTELEKNITSYNVSMGIDENNFCYKDNIITLQPSGKLFERDVPYLLSLRIPKHPIYSCSYKLKLISNPTETLHDKLSYQLLRYINVPRQNGANQSIKIIAFENPIASNDSNDTTIVSQAVSKREELKAEFPNYRIVLFENDKYYLWNRNDINNKNNYTQITTFEDMFIEPSWINQEWDKDNTNNYAYYNIIFSFKGNSDILTNCGTIWLEMVRNNFDYDINNGDYYGRYISSEDLQVKIYELENLLDGTNDISSLSHVGIYSHPDFMFAINNEELRIGQTGYFELNDYEINSIAVAPINENLQDNIFTIDYQYFIENLNNNDIEEDSNDDNETNS